MKLSFYPFFHIGKKMLTTLSMQQKRRNDINAKEQERLRNTDFCLISSNCNGGVVCHDLGQPFRTQFVNLWMMPKDFIQYLSNLDYYNSIDEIRFLSEDERGLWDFPVGVIENIHIYFTHYSTDEEAKKKWNERKKRINADNLFIIMTEQNGCTKEDLVAFDALPFKNKVVFTYREYDDISSSFYIPGFEKGKQLGNILAFKSPLSAARWYDVFPFVDWFNGTYHVGR